MKSRKVKKNEDMNEFMVAGYKLGQEVEVYVGEGEWKKAKIVAVDMDEQDVLVDRVAGDKMSLGRILDSTLEYSDIFYLKGSKKYNFWITPRIDNIRELPVEEIAKRIVDFSNTENPEGKVEKRAMLTKKEESVEEEIEEEEQETDLFSVEGDNHGDSMSVHYIAEKYDRNLEDSSFLCDSDNDLVEVQERHASHIAILFKGEQEQDAVVELLDIVKRSGQDNTNKMLEAMVQNFSDILENQSMENFLNELYLQNVIKSYRYCAYSAIIIANPSKTKIVALERVPRHQPIRSYSFLF